MTRLRDVEEVRDVEWGSGGLCPLLSWNCLGVWQGEGWDVTVGDRAGDGTLLAVGEEGGPIRLYRLMSFL